MSRPNEIFFDTLTIRQPCVLFGLTLEPREGGVSVSCPDTTDDKRFSRQLSVLQGYLCLALGARPGANGRPTALEALRLPCEEGPDAPLAVWYARALDADTPRSRLLALYNAFGALPGGFDAVPAVLSARLGADAAAALLDGVRSAKQEEGDLFERAPQPLAASAWDCLDLDAMAQALRDAHRAAFC